MLADALQTTLEDAVPLSAVEFVVVDLETTGGSPRDSRITEIGAVLVTGGERIGTFQALVNPEEPIPAFISQLTGIDDFLVRVSLINLSCLMQEHCIDTPFLRPRRYTRIIILNLNTMQCKTSGS